MFQRIWQALSSWLSLGRPVLEPVWAGRLGEETRDRLPAGEDPAMGQSIDAPALPNANGVNPPRPAEGDLVQAIGRQLVRFQNRQNHLQDERMNRLSRELHRQLEGRLDRHAEKVEGHVVARLEALGDSLPATLAAGLDPLAERMAATIVALSETSTAGLRRELADAVAANLRRASLGPVIDALLALRDRIDDERQFLRTAFRRDADLAAHAGARHLQAQHDDAERSFATEILMVLRGMGVELLEVSGPELDPHLQRVVGLELTSRVELDGRIARIARRGFRWNGALLRPEQIMVYKKGD